MPVPHSALVDTRHGIVHYWPQEPLVGDSLRWYGEYLQPIADDLVSLITPGATIIETEAGIGYHSLALAHAAGPGGHLIVYEHRRLHTRVLGHNIAANGVTNVTIMRRGIVASPTAEGSNDAPETIDELMLERMDLLKINMAAHARQILAGATQTLWKQRPLLFMSGFRGDTMPEVVGAARDFGYRFFGRDVPWFNPRNFHRRDENVFESALTELAILAAPEERASFVPPAGYRDIS